MPTSDSKLKHIEEQIAQFEALGNELEVLVEELRVFIERYNKIREKISHQQNMQNPNTEAKYGYLQ